MLILKTTDGNVVHFTDKEAELSVFLKTIYYNNDEIFMNGESKISEDNIIIRKGNKKLLTIVKQLCSFILKYNITTESLSNIYNFDEELPKEIKKCIDIRENFTINEFFTLIDIVNFMDIDTILQILKKKLYYIIKIETLEDITEIFKLNDYDFTKKEKDAMSLYNDMLTY